MVGQQGQQRKSKNATHKTTKTKYIFSRKQVIDNKYPRPHLNQVTIKLL